MKRREFIRLASGAAAAWPIAARAQQPEKMRRIGVLMTVSEADPEGQDRIAALRQGLNPEGRTGTVKRADVPGEAPPRRDPHGVSVQSADRALLRDLSAIVRIAPPPDD